MRFVVTTGALAGALLIVLCGLWGTGALYFRLPGPELLRAGLALAFAGLSLVAAWSLVRRRPKATLVWAGLLAGMIVWWTTIQPSHQRDWAAVVEFLPRLEIAGDDVRVENVRNFIWRTETDVTPRWENRQFRLSQVQGVDVFLSYWTGPAIAHLIVSFDMKDDVPLAFSIEIRKEKTEEYSALAGFFKSYELAILAVDERDVVKLRTNVWQEDVRLYRLGVGPAKAQDLLRGYAREIARIGQNPVFYNTLTGNCTTIAFRLAQALWPDIRPDWRVLASGYLPDYLHGLGAVDTRLPLEALKEAARISEKARSLGDAPDFSARLRDGVPKP